MSVMFKPSSAGDHQGVGNGAGAELDAKPLS